MGRYALKDAITESKAQVLYIYGEKEMSCVKDSAQLFKEMHPNSTLYEAKGYSHGYLSAYLPLEWMALVNPFLKNDILLINLNLNYKVGGLIECKQFSV